MQKKTLRAFRALIPKKKRADTLAELATTLGRQPITVRTWMSGKRSMPPELEPAARQFIEATITRLYSADEAAKLLAGDR